MQFYNWKYADDYSIILYWRGYYAESLSECRRAIVKCPDSERKRITANMQFCINNLPPSKK